MLFKIPNFGIVCYAAIGNKWKKKKLSEISMANECKKETGSAKPPYLVYEISKYFLIVVEF